MWISLCHILYPVSVRGAGIRISEITTFPFVCLHLFNSDLLILDMIVLALDLQLYHNILIVFWLKILWRGLDLGKCKSISERKHLLNLQLPNRATSTLNLVTHKKLLVSLA